jgi:hypothetical protein
MAVAKPQKAAKAHDRIGNTTGYWRGIGHRASRSETDRCDRAAAGRETWAADGACSMRSRQAALRMVTRGKSISVLATSLT